MVSVVMAGEVVVGVIMVGEIVVGEVVEGKIQCSSPTVLPRGGEVTGEPLRRYWCMIKVGKGIAKPW
jgi:hypothetical protein